MRILSRGQRPEDTIHQGTCNTCGTRVEFTRAEGEITYDQRDGDFVRVNCPCCGGGISSPLDNMIYQ